MKLHNLLKCSSSSVSTVIILFAICSADICCAAISGKAAMPDKIVKPDDLSKTDGNQDKISVDHPFNRALISTFNTSPQLRSQVKAQYVLAEGVSQALSGWRPSITMQGTIGRSWADTESPSYQKGTAFNTSKSLELNLNQNLFKGGQTVAQVAQAKANVCAGFSKLASTEQQVLLAAINAYLTLWSKRVALKLYTDNVKIKQKTQIQTQARYKVGELTLTDLSQAESELAGALAKQIAAQADVNNASSVYLQVVGEAPGDVTPPPPLIRTRAMPADRMDVEKRALKNNPDICSAEYTRQVQYYGIDVAKAAILPSIDLNGKAARNLNSNSTTLRQNSGSVSVVLNLPIYQRGTEWSQIRQATQDAAKAKIDKVTAQRQVLQNAEQNWENWSSYASQIEQLKVQIQASKVNLEGTRQENLVGERTVLDVLTAENALLSAETDLATTQQNYLLAGYSVLAAMGELTAVDLNLSVEAYPVEANYEYVKSQLIGGSTYPTR